MIVVELRVTNVKSVPYEFRLEPWGGKYAVPCGGSLTVIVSSPSNPRLEWEFAEDGDLLILHDPAGADATVYDGETQVIAL